MPQFSYSPQNPAHDKAACHRGVCPPDRLCASCEFPAGFSKQLTEQFSLSDFENWLKASQLALSAWGSRFNGYQSALVGAEILIQQFRNLGGMPVGALNFGDDVATAPRSSAVPVGNTGTPSTGAGL